MKGYHAGDLSDMLKAGKLRNVHEVDKTLVIVRQALAQEAWSASPSDINQYEADICLLLDMQRYHRDCDEAEKLLDRLPAIVARGVQ